MSVCSGEGNCTDTRTTADGSIDRGGGHSFNEVVGSAVEKTALRMLPEDDRQWSNVAWNDAAKWQWWNSNELERCGDP
ncbi:hypothetical protein HPP92_011299 [Vanilla planifolia]|uniref:Uncharacterized protein n=1 Tax=Vanilla planifolia TaxID=51239 RepID=A0A835R0L1_VANPL|nr:hypothetical protein HPP92_011601 [Vanilla planifolia]KAG0483215.1 hypothetical protein HPP92_011299 [Vanilla planifolia]